MEQPLIDRPAIRAGFVENLAKTSSGRNCRRYCRLAAANTSMIARKKAALSALTCRNKSAESVLVTMNEVLAA
jgi:hypothetical protein